MRRLLPTCALVTAALAAACAPTESEPERSVEVVARAAGAAETPRDTEDPVAEEETVSETTSAVDLDLADLRWSHRPLLLFAPTPDDRGLAAMLERLEQLAGGVADRQMALIVVTGDAGTIDGAPLTGEAVARLREEYAPERTRLTVVLVGKDGGEKARRVGPVPPETFFAQIDAMPMRRQEVRDRR